MLIRALLIYAALYAMPLTSLRFPNFQLHTSAESTLQPTALVLSHRALDEVYHKAVRFWLSRDVKDKWQRRHLCIHCGRCATGPQDEHRWALCICRSASFCSKR